MQKVKLILVPGLGDQAPWWKWLAGRWVKFDVGWSESEEFEAKLSRLLQLVDKYQAAGLSVCLVGASAGASLAFNAFACRPDLRAVLISGKLRRPETVGEEYFSKYPALRRNFFLVGLNEQKLSVRQKQRILCIRPTRDSLISPEDMVIPGTTVLRTKFWGHSLGIVAALLLYRTAIRGFARARS